MISLKKHQIFRDETKVEQNRVRLDPLFQELSKTFPQSRSAEVAFIHLVTMVAHLRLYSKTKNAMHQQYSDIAFFDMCLELGVPEKDQKEFMQFIEEKWV